MDYLIWSFTILLLIIGLLGSVVPMLPGTTFIMLGVVLQKLMLSATMSWYVVGWIALIWVVSVLADIAGVIIGTRLFGGSKWGMTGASGGACCMMKFDEARHGRPFRHLHWMKQALPTALHQ